MLFNKPGDTSLLVKSAQRLPQASSLVLFSYIANGQQSSPIQLRWGDRFGPIDCLVARCLRVAGLRFQLVVLPQWHVAGQGYSS